MLLCHNGLQHIFYVIHHVRDLILSHLCASECALVFALIQYEPTDYDIKKFLQLDNEVPQYKSWINRMIKDSYHVLMIGKDVQHLVDRIEDPLSFWKLHRNSVSCSVFLTAIKILDILDGRMLAVSPVDKDLRISQGWKRMRSDGTSNVNVLSYRHDTDFTREAFFDIGATYNLRITHAYSESTLVHSGISLVLISKIQHRKYTTKYINLSSVLPTVENAVSSSVECGDTITCPHVSLYIHCKHYNVPNDEVAIRFPILW